MVVIVIVIICAYGCWMWLTLFVRLDMFAPDSNYGDSLHWVWSWRLYTVITMTRGADVAKMLLHKWWLLRVFWWCVQQQHVLSAKMQWFYLPLTWTSPERLTQTHDGTQQPVCSDSSWLPCSYILSLVGNIFNECWKNAKCSIMTSIWFGCIAVPRYLWKVKHKNDIL